MSRWTLVIPEETDRVVRTHLARHGGKKGDLSKFVARAVQKEIFRQTLKEVQNRNAGLDQDEIQRLVDEAVDWSRAHCP